MHFIFEPERFLIIRIHEKDSVKYEWYRITKDLSGTYYWEKSDSYGETVVNEVIKNRKLNWCTFFPFPSAIESKTAKELQESFDKNFDEFLESQIDEED